MPSRPLLALIAVIAFGLGSVSTGHATVFDLPEGQLHFTPPDGFCSLEPDQYESDARLFDLQAEVLRSSNCLVAYVVDCETLAAWRDDPSLGTGDYGLFMLPLSNGELRRFDQLSRAAFLDEMERVYGGIGTGDIRAAIGERARQVLDDLNIGEIRSLGVLDRDDDAIYVGLVGSFDDGGSAYTLAVVMATTLLNGYPASFNLYTGYIDDLTFDDLLARQQTHAQTLVAINDNAVAGASAADWRSTWRRMALYAIAGVALGALLAWGLVAWRRRRQRDPLQ
jgi:hypothetical protein